MASRSNNNQRQQTFNLRADQRKRDRYFGSIFTAERAVEFRRFCAYKVLPGMVDWSWGEQSGSGTS